MSFVLNSCACCGEALAPDDFDGICVECDDEDELEQPTCHHKEPIPASQEERSG